MAQFTWEGRTRTGEPISGTMTARTDSEVMERLRSQQITASTVKKEALEIEINIPTLGGIPNKTLVVFTRQFATMIDAGLPLVQCLDILASQESHKGFQKVLYQIKADVESGSTFNDSLKKHTKVFDELFVNLVAAGEVGGILDTILNRLAQYIEKNAKLRAKIKSAFTYPIGILSVSVVVVAVLLWKVVPTFERMFQDMGQGSLPGPTQIVIDLSRWFGEQWHIVFSVLIGSFILMGYLLRTELGRKTADAILLKTPLFGALITKASVAKFTRTLGTMVSSGVPILDGLAVTAKAAGNTVIEAGIMHVHDRIAEGRSMSEPLAEAKIFPPMVVQMIAVGESTGAMDTMLVKIAEFYEEEVDVAVENLTSLIEPAMLVFMGGIVGGLLISMYLPIFTMADSVETGG